MDAQQYWERALRQTEIVRPRIKPLETFGGTKLPYTYLSESHEASDHTVVRKGSITVDKPTLLLPSNIPQLEGFEFEEKAGYRPDLFMDFLLVRGVRFPSMKYGHETYSLSLYDGGLREARRYYGDRLQQEENLSEGLVVGPEDGWQFSILIFVGTQILKSADGDIRRLLDDYQRDHQG